MAKKDIIPTKDGNLDTFEEKYVNQYPAIAAALGIDAAEITGSTTVITNHRTAFKAMILKKADSKAAGEKNTLTKKLSVNEIRRSAGELKRRPGYTAEIGQELGIIGIDETIPSTDLWKPTLSAKIDGDKIIINFKKDFSGGVKIKSCRNAETEFIFLANDTFPPYYDTREKLDADKPETRQYQAWFIMGDEVVGIPSDILTVTVP